MSTQKTTPHPMFINHVARLVENAGGYLNAHREALQVVDCFQDLDDEESRTTRTHWLDVADEIVRQARVRTGILPPAPGDSELLRCETVVAVL